MYKKYEIKKHECSKCNGKMIPIGVYIDLTKEKEKYVLYKCNDCSCEKFKKEGENK